MKRFFIILILIVTCFIIFAQNTDTVLVEDSNNLYLGRLIGYTGDNIAVLTDSGYYYLIDIETAEIQNKGYIFYDSTNCSGTGYLIETNFFPYCRIKYIYRIGDNYYLRNFDPSSDHANSQLNLDNEECIQIDHTADYYYYEPISQYYIDIIESIVPPLNLY